MASTRLSKDEKKDFADHLSSKLFGAEIKQVKDKITALGPQLVPMLATPEEIEAVKSLRDILYTPRQTLVIFVERSIYENGAHMAWCHHNIPVPLPERVPMHREAYGAEPMKLKFSDEFFKKAFYHDWLLDTKSNRKAFDTILVPLVQQLVQLDTERHKFKNDLRTNLEPINSLKRLKEVAPDLHQAWIDYFGTGVVSKPLAVRFDDVLKVLHERQEKAA